MFLQKPGTDKLQVKLQGQVRSLLMVEIFANTLDLKNIFLSVKK